MVEAILNYVAEMGERPYYYTYTPPEGTPWRNTKGDRQRVEIHDARVLPQPPTLDREGFTLVHHETDAADLYDPECVRECYYPEVEKLVQRATDAASVLVFDHNVRNASRADTGEEGVQNPVRFVHNDYTLGSGPQRVRDLLPAEEAEQRLRGRFSVINVWKPIVGPVLEAPLAFCDASSMRQEEFVATDLRYEDRSGEIYSVQFAPKHRWYTYPRMQADEVLLLKCYDSAEGVARFTAHTAFDLPDGAEEARPRESIEVRTLAFYSS